MVDKDTNLQWSTRFFGQLPVVDGGTLLHCEKLSAQTFLSEVAIQGSRFGVWGWGSGI